MNDADVIAAIRAKHLKANIAEYERAGATLVWERAWLDHGGTIFGPGPYVKVPVSIRDNGEVTIRVYAPARLRRRLARAWVREEAA